ncbi:hypothetical protein G9A89_023958 [Geosiphon pyriformis]|nr:hypothetical protein G9A89_023958 [Geosiphon pyriformis]
MISVVTETKLKDKVCSWIMNKFDGIQVFTSGLESGYLGADIAIIMDVSLAKYVCKVSKVSGRLISVKLLFKNKLLVTVLGLYVGATLEKRLAHFHIVNSIVAEALNDSIFIVLGGDFNKNDSGCSASFKKCLNLMHSAVEATFVKTWSWNSGLVKTAAFSRFHKLELLATKDSWIWVAINKYMEVFVDNKGQMIRSVLEKSFRKVTLDHLVNNKDLVLEPDLVKGRVDSIMENSTRKCTVKSLVSSCWQVQFFPLNHVSDNAFCGVIKQIDLDEFLLVVKNLPDGKATGLSGYKIHDGLDQREVFSPFLWRIFYDSLLCKVKKHKSFFEYWIDSKFVARMSRIESNAGLIFYLAAGVFINDTIWVDNCHTMTQNILNIANEFFELMDILINMEKTIAISINPRTSNIFLKVSGSPISITKTGEAHWYLDFVKSGDLAKGSSSVFESPSKLDVSNTDHFGFIHSSLKDASLLVISVYTNGFVKDFDTSDTVGGAVTYFSDLGLYIGVEIYNLLSSTLTKIQAVALALECILASLNVTVFFDSQASLDACQAELKLVAPDFHNRYWMEHCHISNLVKYKNISVTWTKVKDHSGVLGNECTDCFYTILCKGLIFEDWLADTKASFVDTKLTMSNLVEFVWDMCHGSLYADGSLYNIIRSLLAKISDVAYLLGIERNHVTNFGLSIGHLFFAGTTGEVTVNIVA